MTAQTGEVDIVIQGQGGHGAIPHKANDALIIMAQLINSYQSIVSRNLNQLMGASSPLVRFMVESVEILLLKK